ncbi:MAG: vanadium-dependent haloperoxidase [Candidatus Sulfotelmatobacter sp.]
MIDNPMKLWAGSSRRKFLSQSSAAAALAGYVPLLRVALPTAAYAEQATTTSKGRRTTDCVKIRKNVASANAAMAVPANCPNGDEDLYTAKIGSYHKGLPHDEIGEVDPRAYRTLTHALESGRPADFEKIPLGGNIKLSNPQGGLAFDLEACDSHQTFMATPPELASAWRAGEMVENYWMALLRDINFADYPTSATATAAITELNKLSDFRGSKQKNRITSQTLFRGCTAGDLIGPYVSQFLVQPFKFGALNVNQQYSTYQPGLDYIADSSSWLSVQNGQGPFEENTLDSKPRYIRNGRDLCAYVHLDGPYQAYLAAAQWMMQNDVPLNVGNPYEKSLTQEGFQTFGGPHVLSLLAEVSNRALKAVWFHKWYVHRTLRPEAYGGLVHWTMNGARQYPLHPDVLNSQAVAGVFSKHGTYLLPLAYPEGCPQHPSYGQGHAAIAGACVTILKAFFSTDTVTFFNPVEASSDGLSLVPYKGPDAWRMSVTNELHKLAGNIGMARNMAGIHWRSDYDQALLLGEAVALSLLRDQRATFNEVFDGFSFTSFNGTALTV